MEGKPHSLLFFATDFAQKKTLMWF